jgi:hypothetical protein
LRLATAISRITRPGCRRILRGINGTIRPVRYSRDVGARSLCCDFAAAGISASDRRQASRGNVMGRDAVRPWRSGRSRRPRKRSPAPGHSCGSKGVAIGALRPPRKRPDGRPTHAYHWILTTTSVSDCWGNLCRFEGILRVCLLDDRQVKSRLDERGTKTLMNLAPDAFLRMMTRRRHPAMGSGRRARVL